MKGGGDMQMQTQLNLPAGFRFHPTDEELVEHYLCRRCAGHNIAVRIIAEIDLYKFDPWQLPGMAVYGEKEWYFFSPRDRKYPNGSRPNRAAGSGYWKATGADKPVGKPHTLGIKKALVFYAGKAPAGVKTDWIMHEYRLANADRSAGKTNNLRLDDWVLCRIYNKKGTSGKHYNVDREESVRCSDSAVQKPNVDVSPYNYMEILTPAPQSLTSQRMSNYMHFETSQPVPKLHTNSSSSEHVFSPEFNEVESETKWSEFEKALDFQLTYMDGFQGDYCSSGMQCNDQISLFEDMFGYMSKPF